MRAGAGRPDGSGRNFPESLHPSSGLRMRLLLACCLALPLLAQAPARPAVVMDPERAAKLYVSDRYVVFSYRITPALRAAKRLSVRAFAARSRA